ncbi:MAG TPA: diacylglycerol kinase [Burkholderiales bacterium]|nr:diacylglycerol kinase [Burkholderiales bacterium]
MESRHKKKPLLARPFIALRLSLRGLAAAWRHEVPFRLEVLAAAVLAPLGLFLGQTAVERALLLGSLLLVLLVELVNSAIETTLDRISLEDHPLIGRAKDIGSAAVFIALANAAAVWLLILLA